MAILRAAVNLRARVARRTGAQVAADLRLIKVNKPFMSIIKLAFKGRNPEAYKLPVREGGGVEWAYSHPPLRALIARHISKLKPGQRVTGSFML